MRINISENNEAATLQPKETVAEGVKLESLTVNAGNLKFDPNETEYSMKVDSGTERLLINAVTADKESFYTISGNNNLKEGSNNIQITVTDKEGNTGHYNIRVLVGEEITSAAEKSSEAAGRETLAGVTDGTTGEKLLTDDIENQVSSVIKYLSEGNIRYVSYGVLGCGALAVVFWLAYIIKRASVKRKHRKAAKLRRERSAARMKELEGAKEAEEELLRQVDELLARQRQSRISETEEEYDDFDDENYDDYDDDEYEEEYEEVYEEAREESGEESSESEYSSEDNAE